MNNSTFNRYLRYLDSINAQIPAYEFTDKARCINLHISNMLVRTQSMFKWENLPDTIPERSLELYLQCNGFTCIAEHEGKLYAFYGGLGGEPDPYHMPTICTVSNPALKLSKNYRINEDCIILTNDDLYMGLLPINMKYAAFLTENELSMKIAAVNTRITSLISAPDDRTRESAEKYLDDVEAGKIGIAGENAFFDGIRVQPYMHTGNTNIITNLIENEQYFKASWYNEIGLNANYNMKRETINSDESQLNNDALLPMVDNMLKCRQEGAKKINEMFGTDIKVSLNSSWQDNQEEVDAEQARLESESLEVSENTSNREEDKENDTDTGERV